MLGKMMGKMCQYTKNGYVEIMLRVDFFFISYIFNNLQYIYREKYNKWQVLGDRG